MPDQRWVTRVKAWIRAVTRKDWMGQPGETFNDGLEKLSQFAKEDLELPKHIKETYNAGWGRAKGTVLGESASKAIKSFEEAEKVKVEAELARRTTESKVRQEKATAIKLQAETHKLLAEAHKADAEARKADAEAMKIRLDSLLTFTDRLKEMGVAFWFDENRALQWHRVPKDADWEGMNSRILSGDLLDSLAGAIAERASRSIIVDSYVVAIKILRDGMLAAEVMHHGFIISATATEGSGSWTARACITKRNSGIPGPMGASSTSVTADDALHEVISNAINEIDEAIEESHSSDLGIPPSDSEGVL